jgi:hypothetical protein
MSVQAKERAENLAGGATVSNQDSDLAFRLKAAGATIAQPTVGGIELFELNGAGGEPPVQNRTQRGRLRHRDGESWRVTA